MHNVVTKGHLLHPKHTLPLQTASNNRKSGYKEGRVQMSHTSVLKETEYINIQFYLIPK